MKIAMKTTLIQHSIIITALFLIKLSFAEIGFGDSTLFTRRSFPHGFIFGVASAAYQYEGAAFEDGKGPSIWDNFTHQFPEKIADRSNGDVATNFYNLYKEDVKLLKHIGVDTFRMSISWPRILPCGKLSGGVNKEGIVFYNKVFNELIANGIIPFVTLFHWDVPQALEDEYGGFLSPLIIDDFRDFAELCFKEFGDRVKYWTTFNEPNGFASSGYVETFVGNYAPGRCSNRSICSQGNSATEPYVVGHHQLLSHAVVVKLYRTKYQGTQKGKIGMSLVTPWFVPYSNSKLDVKATQRALDFNYGWFADPIFYGNYPKIMQSLVGDRLPNFTTKQSEMLKGSFDFFGLNYYTGIYAAHVLSRTGNISSETDSLVRLSFARNGVPIRGPSGYPKGLHDLLIYTKHKYNNPTIYITENGVSDNNNGTQDLQRIDFYRSHLQAIQKATEEGVNVKGFMAWSFLDDFEWVFGYTQRYGLCHVDYNNRLNRILKQSAIWFKNSLRNG